MVETSAIDFVLLVLIKRYKMATKLYKISQYNYNYNIVVNASQLPLIMHAWFMMFSFKTVQLTYKWLIAIFHSNLPDSS